MEEIIPIVAGFASGALLGSIQNVRMRGVLSFVAILASGLAGVWLSGEYVESWSYLLLDIAEALIAFPVGILAVRLLARLVRLRQKSSDAQ